MNHGEQHPHQWLVWRAQQARRARWIVRELWGRDLDAEMDRWVYVGDSTNDQLMFQHFAHSVGVANVARFVPQLQHLPRYVTQGERGAGFAELVQAILANR